MDARPEYLYGANVMLKVKSSAYDIYALPSCGRVIVFDARDKSSKLNQLRGMKAEWCESRRTDERGMANVEINAWLFYDRYGRRTEDECFVEIAATSRVSEEEIAIILGQSEC
jgi:hypothetical protein